MLGLQAHATMPSFTFINFVDKFKLAEAVDFYLSPKMSPVKDKTKEVACFATLKTAIIGTGDAGQLEVYPNFSITVNHWATA